MMQFSCAILSKELMWAWPTTSTLEKTCSVTLAYSPLEYELIKLGGPRKNAQGPSAFFGYTSLCIGRRKDQHLCLIFFGPNSCSVFHPD